jgi:hypothetical protein
MPTIREPARETPVAHECDVCVIGGSCTAARLGARVALIERLGYFGGAATASLVNIWHSTFDLSGQRQIIGGLTTEVTERLKLRGAIVDHGNQPHWQFAFNSAELILELDRLVVESGARPFLHCRFVQPVLAGRRIEAVIVEDKSGRRAIRAKVFVDASGDGDLVERAGLPYREMDDLQPPTTCVLLTGVQELRAAKPGFDLGGTVSDPRHPDAIPRGFAWDAPVPGIPELRMVAASRVSGANCRDADQLTRAEIEGRRQVRAIRDILKREAPEGKTVEVAGLPALIGIRETRHPECLYRVTEQDVLRGTRFPDAVANGTYRVDIHHSGKPGLTFRYLDGREEYVAPGQKAVTSRWLPEGQPTAAFYQTPYRALVPQGSVNLLVAGRLIDADRGAYGALRVMVNCNQTGQAAGAAAWLALSEKQAVTDIDPARLLKTLSAQGAVIL